MAVLIPIVELTLGPILVKPFHSQLMKTTVMTLVFFIGFLVAIYLFRDILENGLA
ncbi:hypothetical protein [Secundilactobacillus oryzae]|uniref:hypothetical protein n=1 Tax=Secundilactobacillus oryzae TaxID=1202668 RepID=UPI000AE0EE61|nr:hypothetical protein [Secundilactobacillus oryzae]